MTESAQALWAHIYALLGQIACTMPPIHM